MSFILDALKKSQATRQQHAGPGTITVETAPRAQQNHRWWAIAAAIVLVNLTVILGFIYWATRNAPPATMPAANQALAEGATTVQGSMSSAGSEAQLTAPLKPRATLGRGEVSPLSAEVKEPRADTPPAARPPVSAARQVPANAERPNPVIVKAPAQDSDYLPTLAELQLENRIALSPLHVDVHVFNEDPRRRFVLINARKYKEGESITEGPLLESIRRDGVVLYYRGERFLLPRD